MIQIVIHTMNTYASVDQNLAVSCSFFKIVMWEVVENAADNIQGKKQFAKFRMSQIEEVKTLYRKIYFELINAQKKL